MLKDNKKKITVFLFMAACVAVSIAAHNPEAKQQGFKNLQVLPKDISHDSLDHVMHAWSKSLGVRCNFCHAPSKDSTQKWPDFASDDKPEKEIARHMFKMTVGINSQYFNFNGSAQPDTIQVVTCNTCHHGSPHPEAIPAATPPPPPPPAK